MGTKKAELSPLPMASYNIVRRDNKGMSKKNINLTRQWIKIFSAAAFLYALVRTSWWSYTQTEEFLRIFNSVGDVGVTMSHVLSIIVQYGQNVVLWIGMQERKEYVFLQRKLEDLSKSKRGASQRDKERLDKIIFKSEQELKKKLGTAFIWLGGYFSFLVVDIFTNVGQFLLTFNDTGADVISSAVGASPNIVLLAKAGGVLMMVVVAFVEEAVPGVLTAFGTAFNDIFEYYGWKRLRGWDFMGESVSSDNRVDIAPKKEHSSNKTHNKKEPSRGNKTNPRQATRSRGKNSYLPTTLDERNQEPRWLRDGEETSYNTSFMA